MKKCVIILSHCDTQEKKEVLVQSLEILRSIGNFDIILTSHIPLPEEIISQTDYFIFDKSNPILKWPRRSMLFWKKVWHNNTSLKLFRGVNDYGWTPLNQIKKGGMLGLSINCSHYYYVNYDLQFTEEVINFIKNDKSKNSILFEATDGDTSHNPGMLLFKLNSRDNGYVVNRLSFDDYLYGDHAEDYFESVLKKIDFETSPIITKDRIQIDEKIDIFNNSTDESYKYYVSNIRHRLNTFPKHILFWEIKKDLLINLDNELKIIKKGETYFFPYKKSVSLLGDGTSVDLLEVPIGKFQYITDEE